MSTRRELANAIRALSMDAVQQANSGHPGAPMGMADIAEVLWNDFLRHNPANPSWPNRDRFVLSNGHGSMLIYSMLHLTGYDLPIEELKNFRQFHSKTPGHPELGYTPGVETTTGPLGQGLANAVGMALAEKVLAAQFNRPGHEIVDHHTYVFMGDGCLMEGISHEVCSLAGTLQLSKLICFYDDNGISIDGKVHGWFSDDTPGRFEAYGWHVVRNVDGHDAAAIKRAVEEAKASDKPSLICCKTIIGFGSPNAAGTHGVHGAPLGGEEIAASREFLKWPHAPFEIPQQVYDAYDARAAGAKQEEAWKETFAAYKKAHPEMAAEFERRLSGELPDSWGKFMEQALVEVDQKAATVATRKASESALNLIGPHLSELFGGSADLTHSNNTWWKGCEAVTREDAAGNYLFYGVREFGMTAIMNGLALHGGFIPYGGTFLVFSDYARNAVRMAALMKQRNVLVYTHDSIGLGEDGPTHQPIEHLASLRLIPNMSLWRPCDAVETLVAWQAAIERKDGPTSLIFTRQNLPHQARDGEQLQAIRRGGYVLRDSDGEPQAIIIATGSEVALAVAAAEQLKQEGVRVRVVSMPSTDTFDAQDAAYKESVLPRQVTARVAVEAAAPDLWFKYVGTQGQVIGMTGFGESAPASMLFKHFGFTPERVAEAVRAVIG